MVQSDEALVKKAFQRIKKLDLWRNAHDIIKSFGREMMKELSDKTKFTGTAEVGVGEHVLRIHSESYGQFYENCDLQIWWNNRLVAKLDQTMFSRPEDEVRILKKDSQSAIVLRKFEDGEWLKYFSVASIKKIRVAEQKGREKKERAQKAAEKKDARKKVLSELARDIHAD